MYVQTLLYGLQAKFKVGATLSRVTMLPLCASLLAHPMKPLCSIEQGGVTQPHSEGNITGPIANILYGEVVKKKRDPILPPLGSNIGNPNKFDT